MSVHHFDYDKTYFPLAPVVSVVLRTRFGESTLHPAFLDTGADATIVPLTILQQIGARYSGKQNLVGSTGRRVTVGLYPILVLIGSDIIYGIEAVGYGEEIVLGRDVINQMTVTLEGPLGFCELRI